MDEEIAVIDFDSQYTQLIARNLRKLGVFCRIYSHKDPPRLTEDNIYVRGIILSGGPHCVNDINSPKFDFTQYKTIPILGICYGAQLIAKYFSGKIGTLDKHMNKSEFGSANLIETVEPIEHKLFNNIDKFPFKVWMSHKDTVLTCGEGDSIASTDDVEFAVFKIKNQDIYGVQFHPEVEDTHYGNHILQNFCVICNINFDWTQENVLKLVIENTRQFIFNDENRKIAKIKLGEQYTPRVAMAVSGGVDSTVAGFIIQMIVGKFNFYPILVDNGLMRQNEIEDIRKTYQNIGFRNLVVVDAKKLFMKHLNGISDPEEKRKRIGHLFIKVFQNEIKNIETGLHKAHKISRFTHRKFVQFLGQGTIYPDVIESGNQNNGNVIKSHHNVGGLPKNMKLQLIEPLRLMFKDDVRSLGSFIGIPDTIVHRHPFPGPGLAIRIIGPITQPNVELARETDFMATQYLTKYGYFQTCWQFGCILLANISTVGVQGDVRVYKKTVVIRAVDSVNGMTASVHNIPIDILEGLATYLCNKIPDIGRVVYDITSKPPGTIEWE
jgi:GMP synthase (glutamine-hydrolysing)